METYFLEKDIALCCITASSFPDGVLAAHQQLHARFANDGKRQFFGISRPEKNTIIYKAAVEMREKETAGDFGGESGTIQKGKYTSIVLKDFRKDIPAIGKTFQQLLTNPDIDPNGYCVEMYIGSDDVRCMVRLNK
jgi:hypothetical protein